MLDCLKQCVHPILCTQTVVVDDHHGRVDVVVLILVLHAHTPLGHVHYQTNCDASLCSVSTRSHPLRVVLSVLSVSACARLCVRVGRC